MLIVCNKIVYIKILEIKVLLITNATLKEIIIVIYESIFLVFLSFLVSIGKFIVSAGAYQLIMIIANINNNITDIYL